MTDTPVQKERPLSPHLQIYKPQITSMSSIFHRMSGIALMLGLFLFAWGVIALASGREAYEYFIWFCQSTFGQLMLVGWTMAFFYHMSTGLRHFFLDAGYMYEKKVASISGFVVIGVAIILTALTWAYIYRDMILGGAV